jgi:ATP-binding protein involved in chromosome partitioning
LAQIVEPQLVRALGELGFLGQVGEANGTARVELVLPVTGWPNLGLLEASIEAVSPGASVVVRAMNDDEKLTLRNFLRGEMTADPGPGEHGHAEAKPKFLDKLSKTRVLGISSGKGGVGKSSVTINLAISLAALGHQVGVLDADVYGFSLPKMLGATNDPIVLGDTVIPTLAHGVRCVSMGYFVPDEQPVIWRGPMLHKAIEQLVTEAWWDEPDFLLIDMPPGTGDVALTLSEVLPRIEMYVVTTPQAAAGPEALRDLRCGRGPAHRRRTRRAPARSDTPRDQAARRRRHRRARRPFESRQRGRRGLRRPRQGRGGTGSRARLSSGTATGLTGFCSDK